MATLNAIFDESKKTTWLPSIPLPGNGHINVIEPFVFRQVESVRYIDIRSGEQCKPLIMSFTAADFAPPHVPFVQDLLRDCRA